METHNPCGTVQSFRNQCHVKWGNLFCPPAKENTMVALNITVLGVTDVKSFLQRTAKTKIKLLYGGEKKKDHSNFRQW